MVWTKPHSTNVPAGGWVSPDSAIDGNINTYASTSTDLKIIEFLVREIQCDKVRFYVSTAWPSVIIAISVWYEGSYHEIVNATAREDSYVVVSLGGTHTVTKAKLTADIQPTTGTMFLHEFDFNDSSGKTAGQKELKTNWPNEKGLTARTQTQKGRSTSLVPQHSLVPNRLKEGLI